jgi:two-component system phosphate regulon response regulator PhoB
LGERILIIENDTDLLSVLEEILSTDGYQVTGVTDVPDVDRLLRDSLPDLVVTDYLLNGITGDKICRRIKTCPEFSKLPIVVVSAWRDGESTFHDRLCNVFIPKPFDLWEFLTRVHGLTRLYSRNGS